jgi:Putative zinc-finger
MNARMMEHQEAIDNLVAERYLLGELSETDREAYEEHLFCCPVCFEQVKAGTEFVGQLRRMSGEQSAVPTALAMPGFLAGLLRQRVAAFACLLLIGVSGFSVHQYSVISALKRPQITQAFFLSEGAKGPAINQLTVRPNTRFGLDLQLLNPGDFSAYEARILSESGELKSAPLPIPSGQARETIHIQLNSGDLGQGSYFIVINGLSPDGHKTEITRYSFGLLVQE